MYRFTLFTVALAAAAFDTNLNPAVTERDRELTEADGRYTSLVVLDQPAFDAAVEAEDVGGALRALDYSHHDDAPTDEKFSAAVDRHALAMSLNGGLLPGWGVRCQPNEDGGFIAVVKGTRYYEDCAWTDRLSAAVNEVAKASAGDGAVVTAEWNGNQPKRELDTVDDTRQVPLP